MFKFLGDDLAKLEISLFVNYFSILKATYLNFEQSLMFHLVICKFAHSPSF